MKKQKRPNSCKQLHYKPILIENQDQLYSSIQNTINNIKPIQNNIITFDEITQQDYLKNYKNTKNTKNNKISSTIYSKFIVKGLKYDKIKQVKNNFNKIETIKSTRISNDKYKEKSIQKTIRNKLTEQPTTNDLIFSNAKSNFNYNLIKSSSENQYKRPLSSKQHKKYVNQLNRPKTAQNSKLKQTKNQELLQIKLGINCKKIVKLANQDEQIRYRNHIKRNKQKQIRKKSSVYLTTAAIQANKHTLKQLNSQIYKTNREIHQNKSRQQIHNSAKIRNDKQIEQQNKVSLNLFESEKQNKQPQHIIQQAPQLKQKQIENVNQFKEQSYSEAIKYYQDFYHICKMTKYKLEQCNNNSQKGLKEDQTILKKSLNILQIERIVKIQHSQNLSKDDKQQLYEIIKQLSFFAERKKQIFEQIFQMKYQILTIQQDSVLINYNSIIQYLYIILHGSVRCLSIRQVDSLGIDLHQSQQTLFDGEIFGLPKITNKLIYQDKVIAAQQCLLLKIPYQGYRKIYQCTANIADKVKLLSQIFQKDKQNIGKLTHQEIQIIATQLIEQNYESNELIIRQDENYPYILFIASGQIQIIYEQIITRQKPIIKDLQKQSRNKIFKSNKILFNTTIHQIRRKNLSNYQQLVQNNEYFTYYYQTVLNQLVRTDTDNWSCYLKQNYAMPYSLISARNDTKIYKLAIDRIKHLSQQIIFQFGEKALKEHNKIQKAKQAKQWQLYKQKIYHDIHSNKQ